VDFSMWNEYDPILSVEQEEIVGDVNWAGSCDNNHGAIISCCS